jgi:hypothetical protein
VWARSIVTATGMRRAGEADLPAASAGAARASFAPPAAQRRDRKASLSSAAKSAGCSQAAKWPPLGRRL